MKVGFFFSSKGIGGAEKNVGLISKELNDRGFDTSIVLLRNAPKLQEYLIGMQVNVKNLDISLNKGLIKAIRFLKKEKFDIIILYGLRSNLLMRPLGKIFGRCKIITGIMSTDDWRKYYHVALDRLSSKFVDLYISNSYAGKTASLKRERMDEDKIVVIHNPINLDEFAIMNENEKDVIRQSYGINKSDFVICQIANLRIMKGHKLVVEAIENIAKKYSQIKVIFAGKDDSNGEILEYIKQKKLEDKFIVTGFVNNIRDILGISDLNILPSYWEGLPVSIQEAMAMGVPVIATNVGGISELIDETSGILIQPGNEKELENAIIKLIENKDQREIFANKAYKKVKENFSKDIILDKYLNSFYNLTGGHNV